MVVLLGRGAAGAPYVRWCFPPGREKDALVENIKQFCFPDLDQYPKSKLKAYVNHGEPSSKRCVSANLLAPHLNRETFSFVLTESDGAKR